MNRISRKRKEWINVRGPSGSLINFQMFWLEIVLNCKRSILIMVSEIFQRGPRFFIKTYNNLTSANQNVIST